MINERKRQKKLEKEAAEQGLKPTNELEVDESNLSEEEKGHIEAPIGFFIIGGVLFLVIIALFIVILVLQHK